jgi:propionate CoA-transferase
VTAGAGGFVDITSRAKKIVFSGYFNAGAKLDIEDGKAGHREGRQDRQEASTRSSTSASPAGAPSRRGRTSPMSPSAA